MDKDSSLLYIVERTITVDTGIQIVRYRKLKATERGNDRMDPRKTIKPFLPFVDKSLSVI